ncbi:PAS domain-containing hybrid sensor histidine kinase/response regulator [Desulfobacter vibrioformis]|uniref:PAS domain-containing hybrid sensor histidine kinase/response regulator n=1 Tax=Desulfobacter vibrioformis TaxID=34031 RepID=UPI00068DFD6D|nr:PAS domain S-box protein [Desulfobacter vibrioformis]
MSNQKSNHDRSSQFEWPLNKRLGPDSGSNEFYEPYYGDVTELNTCRLILDSVGKETLQKIAEDAINLLETSVAVYESNGDYAFGMFSSRWCRLMDTASRKLCKTDDNRSALNSGCWLCHENCWNDSAKAAMELGRSTDIQCVGGINLYAEPIYAGGKVVGVINIGYGTPPADPERLKELAETFDVDLTQLKKQANAYDQRPQFIVDLAKQRLHISASLIGEMVEKSMLHKELQKNKKLLEATGRMARVGGWEVDAKTSEVTWTDETLRIHEVPMDYKPTLDKVFDFFHPQDRPELLKAFQCALDGGQFYDMEMRFITAKGNHRWTRTRCEAEVAEGKVIKLKGTFQDITERKIAQRALIESEERFRQLIERMSSGVAVYEVTKNGEDFIFKDFNQAAEKIDQISRTELIEKRVADVFPSIAEFGLFDVLKRVWRTGEPLHYPSAFYKDGRIEGWRENFVYKLPSGKIVSIYNDVTDRKHAENALSKSESFLKSLLNSIPIPVFYIDTDGRYLGFNQPFQTFWGIDETELIGKTGFHINPPDLAAIHHAKDQELLTAGGHQHYESSVQNASGERRDVIFYKAVFHGSDGMVGGLIGAILDITDRRRTEKELIKQKERLSSLVGSLIDAIVVLDRNGKIKFVNKAACEFFGKKENDLLDIAFGFPVKLGTIFEIETTFGRGKTRFAEAKATEIDWDGESSYLLSLRDITEKKHAMEERGKMNKQLQQTQKLEAIGNLAGGIAHDFNNILSSIIGFAQLALYQVEKNTVFEDDLQEILIAGNRAKDLVKQILTFARKSEEETTPVQPSIITKEVLKFIRSSLPTSIDIRQTITSNSFIMGNPTQIHQILMNLCTNAAHAMEDHGGLLEVCIEDICAHSGLQKETIDLKPGDYIQIRVSDTGTGIPDEIINSIFDPYFTTKSLGEGTGLGLSVVHGIVEAYGGKITVASRLGKGATFTIYLPITKKRQLNHVYTPEDLPTGSEKILYVDDEAPIAKMGKRKLDQLGYSVVARSSSIEALELFRAKPNDFDLVITDMTMPNMTGDVLASELIGIRPDIPVILCTGFSKKISDKSLAAIGIKAFMNKPFLKADLAKTVRKVLDEAKD